MKVTYWVAPYLDDSSAYSIRAKTRREVIQALSRYPDNGAGIFGPIEKVTVEYEDGFDLLRKCLGEGRPL